MTKAYIFKQSYATSFKQFSLLSKIDSKGQGLKKKTNDLALVIQLTNHSSGLPIIPRKLTLSKPNHVSKKPKAQNKHYQQS